MWIVTSFLILSLLLNLSLGVGAYNLLRSTEKYEDFISGLNLNLRLVLQNMRSIDLRGSFEADDEVGHVFKGLRGMVESLDLFLQPEKE
jgi:hypothetical protein